MTIDAADVEAIARRVAELIGQTSGLVDARAVAAALHVDRDWVYAHARELGVVRLGPGPKARMRFDLAVVRERLVVVNELAGGAAATPDAAGARVGDPGCEADPGQVEPMRRY